MHERYLALANFTGASSGGLSYTIQPVSSAVAAFQQQRGGSPFTVQPVDQDCKYKPVLASEGEQIRESRLTNARLLGIVIPVGWSDPENDSAAMGAANTLLSSTRSKAKAGGDLLDLVFMNDAAANQSPLRSYGTNPLNKLQRIARAYDPEGVFQNLQYGGFLLNRA
jgi:hypothetical protein